MNKNRILDLVEAILVVLVVFSVVAMAFFKDEKVILPGGINMNFVTEEGEPVEGVQVEVFDENKNPVETLTSGENGKARSSKLIFANKLFYRVTQLPIGLEIDPFTYELDLEKKKIDINMAFAKSK